MVLLIKAQRYEVAKTALSILFILFLFSCKDDEPTQPGPGPETTPIATVTIGTAGGVIETDGPPGAAVLAYALEKKGQSVVIISDDHAEKIIKSALESINLNSPVKAFPCGEFPDPEKIPDGRAIA